MGFAVSMGEKLAAVHRVNSQHQQMLAQDTVFVDYSKSSREAGE
jgi:hypothetical protein